ncbi:DUF6850 family outer membrane beta-barrel protein [Capnocytophaga canis]|uniref:DUF6850 domain-containing protein n=1 Tax=Capnocytophaga canis TaxID=1848903 RepID=A0A0B7I5B7_9FLAO|nr:DUF6850 family outer membrane beta-barrel protein [Capnocytophaga canis]CEN45078.1 conserved hypothetical protein [Capnocytophaga canis]
MIKRIFLLMLFSVQIVKGQQRPESVFFSKIYEQYAHLPVFFSEIPMENFTKSSLFYDQNKGELRLGQQNSEEIAFGLITKGLYRHNKFTFWGDTKIERLYEKNKKWNLSYTDVLPEGQMTDPHYFAVSRGSEWNNQRYDLLGGVLLPLVGQKWDLAVSADYDLVQRFRTEYDPRPSVLHNNLIINLSSGIKLGENHKIAFGGSYGHGKTQNTVTYSEELLNTPAAYQKYLRWQIGYGTSQNAKHKTTKRIHNHKSTWLGYHYKTENYLLYAYGVHKYQFNATYQNSNEIVNESEDLLGQYTLNTISGSVGYLRNLFRGKKIHLNTEMSNVNGFNFLGSQQGKNYQSNLKKMELNVSLLSVKNNLIHYDMGASIGYVSSYQKDVLAETIAEHAHLRFAPYFRKEYALKKLSVLPRIKFVYHQKLQNKLENNNIGHYKNIADTDYAGKHIRLFYDEVVYPDFNYFDKNRYEIHFGTDFKKTLDDRRFILLGVSTIYKTTFMKQKENRYHLSLNLTLHY